MENVFEREVDSQLIDEINHACFEARSRGFCDYHVSEQALFRNPDADVSYH